MSRFWCATCDQTFAEDGFCPFDATRLSLPPTQVSGQPEALRAPDAALAGYRPPPRGNDYDKLIGQTLDGRYFIEKKLGEGGMGVVFAARHVVIEKPLAIKVLKKEVAREPATIKRFVQEAKAATRIGHPCIVDVTDFGTTPDGLTYSVMEYVDGTTLAHAIRRGGGPLPLARIVPIIAQIARALTAAHDKGIVHRDLKPENVFLVDRDGRRDFVKIVDFGIAKVTPVDGQPAEGPRLTRAGAVFGTPEYMAPEQAAGRSDTDQRVDVYALATILYEMLVGKVPHRGETMVRTLAMQMLDPIVPPSQARPGLEITPELERVVMKGLAKKRDERYPNMGDFLADIERACPGIPTGIPAPQADRPLQLVPAPPGANLREISAAQTVTDPTAPGPRTEDIPTRRAEARDVEGPRATSKKVVDEPEFVASGRPRTFDHVFTESGAPAPAPRRAARWPWIVAIVLLAGGGGIAAALVLGSGGARRAEAAAVDAAVVARAVDAAVAPVDAVAVVEMPPDAASPDAAVRTGKRPKKVDAGVPKERLTPRGTVALQVFTKPDGGSIYIGDSYRGVSGVTLEEPPGSKARIKCTRPGYDPGFVSVVFDGETEVVLCRPVRPTRCVGNLHNPFDDCPDPEPPE